MHFFVIGINFKTADVSIREKIHFSPEVMPQALSLINEYKSIKGSVILSTCNRVEIYASVSNVEQAGKELLHFISNFHNFKLEDLEACTYQKNCQDAVVHLFKVSSSLDSMVLGEYQIQGQVRDSYFVAKEQKSTNSMLNKLFQTAIQIGKKVRSETKIGEGTVSVATLAVDMVKQIFSEQEDLSVLLIGAGKISHLTATYFQQQFKNCQLTVTNRSGAVELTKKIEGKEIEYAKRFEAITQNEVIIASTSAPNFIVCKHEIMMMQAALEGKTRIFIDLSIPRNIDPEINNIENCFVYSIDDINKMIVSNIDKRGLEVSKAEEIIQDISEDYFDWYSKQFILPTMLEIKKELTILKQNSYNCSQKFVNQLDETQKESLDKLMDLYSDKIIKVIMTNVRKSSSNEDLISMTKTLKSSFTLENEK